MPPALEPDCCRYTYGTVRRCAAAVLRGTSKREWKQWPRCTEQVSELRHVTNIANRCRPSGGNIKRSPWRA